MRLRDIARLFILSVKDSFKGKLWKWLMGGTGSLFALFLFGKNFLNTSAVVSITIGAIIIFALYLIRLVLIFMKNVINHYHFLYVDSIYGEAIVLLKNAFAKIHRLRKLDTISDEVFLDAVLTMCENLKKYFDKKTKSICSVSIKVPLSKTSISISSGKHISSSESVRNLCRDTISAKIRNTDLYNATNHTILGNTAYQKVVLNVLNGDSSKFYYINNDIDSSRDYENTSRAAYPNGQLFYKSELVYPLVPALMPSDKNFELAGFLTIDCTVKNKFDEKYDVAIVEGVADGLYDVIMKRNQFT